MGFLSHSIPSFFISKDVIILVKSDSRQQHVCMHNFRKVKKKKKTKPMVEKEISP